MMEKSNTKAKYTQQKKNIVLSSDSHTASHAALQMTMIMSFANAYQRYYLIRQAHPYVRHINTLPLLTMFPI